MKLRQTNANNLKLTISMPEAEVVYAILNHVRLDSEKNSDVIFELLQLFQNYLSEPDIKVKFIKSKENGWSINV